ncbi:MAG: CvpA family protein [Desulfobacteraceae bacterium]|jgi:membrane protein required for colicin V production|nr:CvpA family protein [Desulfobacteraceae bacterium]
MNWLDIVILIPALWLGFKGFKNGLVKEIAGLAALFLGLWIAVNFSHYIEGLLSENTNISDDYLPLIAFAVLFIVTVILVHLLSKSIDKLVKSVALGWANQLTGLVFGVAKAVLIIGAVIFILDQVIVVELDLIPREITEESLLYQPINELIEFVYPKIKNLHLEEFHVT